MEHQEIRDTVLPAPYLPFKTFLSSLEPFSQGIPPKIDRTLWNQSGFVQGLIMNAYRWPTQCSTPPSARSLIWAH
jgi:hypothetical protein